MSSAETKIQSTLKHYRDSLVKSDADGCAALYTDNGVTMAQNFSTLVGMDAIRKWYRQCFSLIELNVEFEVREIEVVADAYAFARTTSTGTQKKLEGGSVREESNQELFVMQKLGEEWKIARYCFCTMNPP